MLIELKNIDIAIAGKTLLNDVDFHVEEGEFVYLIGRVGSGKSSLLKTIYAELPVAGDGEARVLDHDLHKISRKETQALRRELGIVFQDFQLLHDRTVEANLDFVLKATGWKKKQKRQERIFQVLKQVGLEEKAEAFPHQLSGGEQQRIAIARALLNNPRIILADEPTGNLDKETSGNIVTLLRSICESGTAVVMITHNLELLKAYPGIVYKCDGGKLEEQIGAQNNEKVQIESGKSDRVKSTQNLQSEPTENINDKAAESEQSSDDEDQTPISLLNN